MKTGKTLLILIAAMLIGTTASAQPHQHKNCKKDSPDKEQIIENRVRRIQKELHLDDKTEERFAAIYKEYLTELDKCRPAECPARKCEMNDDEIIKGIERRMEIKQKRLDIEKKYFNELTKVLNAKQMQVIFGEKEHKKPEHGRRNAGKPCPVR